MTESEVPRIKTFRRPLRWKIDDALGTGPLFDLLLSRPHHGVGEWLGSIAMVMRKLSSPSGRAWMRWRQSVWFGSDRADAFYRRSCAIGRLERRRRRHMAPSQIHSAGEK
jgi:hypothetical protein